MKRIAVFPGSFDPITRGHQSIVQRALPLFDEIIVAIGINQDKNFMFSADQREEWIRRTFTKYPSVKTARYEGLTVDFCKKAGANFIIRGLRTSADFEFERTIGQINRAISGDIETVFLLAEPQYNAVCSSVVRDILRNGGNADQFVPEGLDISFAK